MIFTKSNKSEPIIRQLLHEEVKELPVFWPVECKLHKKIDKKMATRKALIITISLFSALFLYGCPSDSDSMDEDIFEVGFETHIPITDNGDGTFNISNGAYRSFFSPRPGASSYELTVIREDGTRRNTVVRTPDQLAKEGDQLMYQIVIGSPTFFISVNEARKNEAIELFTNQLEEVKENYGSLEVKVIQ